MNYHGIKDEIEMKQELIFISNVDALLFYYYELEKNKSKNKLSENLKFHLVNSMNSWR